MMNDSRRILDQWIFEVRLKVKYILWVHHVINLSTSFPRPQRNTQHSILIVNTPEGVAVFPTVRSKKMRILTFRYFQNFLSVFQDIWFWKQAISVVLFGPLFRSPILLKHDILLNFVILGVFNHLNFGLLTSKINPDTLNIIEYT